MELRNLNRFMKIKRFEDILVWKKAIKFSLKVYRAFRNCKDYSFKDQIFRATVSVSNNIAEGFEKNTDRDFVKFLCISKGSCGESRSMLYLAKSMNYIDQECFSDLYGDSVEISKCYLV